MKIVVTEPTYFSAAIPLLRAAGVRIRLARTRRALLREIQGADGLLVRIETRVDAPLLARARRLRVVGSATTGLDHIDHDACRARGVAIRSLHGAHTVPTAEHALALLFALARRIPAASAAMARGEWERERFLGRVLADATLGVIGLGRIGTAVATRALALGMRVVACDPYVKRPREGRIRMTSLPRLLATADAITVHACLTEETRGLLDARALARMRRGAMLVNTARGEIVPWRDLLGALRSERVGSAALDVHDAEPLPRIHPLRRFARSHPDRLILTPHLGASTREAADAASRRIASEVLAALAGGAKAR